MEVQSRPSGESDGISSKVLKFSALGLLQTEHTLRYDLREDCDAWVLSICLLDENKKAYAESVKLAVSRQLAFQLRDYLYENAVPIENWRDVLAELLPAAVGVPG